MRAGALGAAVALAVFVFCLPFLPSVAPLVLAALSAAFALSWVISVLLLRHAALGLMVAAAPLPGLAWALALRLPVGLEAYGFGVVVGMVMADGAVRLLLGGGGLKPPRGYLKPLMLALGVLMASLFSAWRLGLPLLLCSLSTVLLLPAALALLSFGEEFFTQANRVREKRARLLVHFSLLATPRWSLSLCGVALVFAVLGFFELPHPSVGIWLTALLVFAAALFTSRQARTATAAALASILLALYAPGAVAVFCVFAFFALQMAMCAQAEGGWLSALESEAPAFFFAALALGAVLVLVPGRAAPAALACLAAALVFFPAFAVGLEALLPRRRGVDELYRA